MPLPAPQPRKHLHTRQVSFRGYEREDGLWDIEAEILDTKSHVTDSPDRGTLPPGTPLHDMAIRVTLDNAMTIVAITASMASSPFAECPQAEAPMQQMVGQTMGPGWRFAVEKTLGGIKGCTHLRELLFNMATAAYQTMASHSVRRAQSAGMSDTPSDRPPHHLGKCMAWDFNGAVVLRRFPQFAGWQPLARAPRPE